jgi:hypothetical protein
MALSLSPNISVFLGLFGSVWQIGQSDWFGESGILGVDALDLAVEHIEDGFHQRVVLNLFDARSARPGG